jgi:hypothetical protein
MTSDEYQFLISTFLNLINSIFQVIKASRYPKSSQYTVGFWTNVLFCAKHERAADTSFPYSTSRYELIRSNCYKCSCPPFLPCWSSQWGSVRLRLLLLSHNHTLLLPFIQSRPPPLFLILQQPLYNRPHTCLFQKSQWHSLLLHYLC